MKYNRDVPVVDASVGDVLMCVVPAKRRCRGASVSAL